MRSSPFTAKPGAYRFYRFAVNRYDDRGLRTHKRYHYAIRTDGRGKLDGFLWNRHDAEHSLGKNGAAVGNVDAIRYGTPEHGSSSYDLRGVGNFNPNLLHWELMQNAEYRRIFADLVYRHVVKTGGALTAVEGEKRFRARMAEIDDVIVAESARWGYQYGSKGRDRSKWLSNCQSCIDFINARTSHLIAAYQSRGWYPTTAAATLADGTVAAGAEEYAGGTPSPTAVPVFARGATWSFYDRGDEPSGDWKAADYVCDANWKSGAGCAGLGGFAPTLFAAPGAFPSVRSSVIWYNV